MMRWIAALLLFAAPAFAQTGPLLVTQDNGLIGSAPKLELPTTDFLCQTMTGGVSCTLDSTVTQLGTCVGSVSDFCSEAAGGVSFPTTTVCASTACDAAGEFGHICLDTDETYPVWNICYGASGYQDLGNIRGLAANTSSSSSIDTTAAETGFSNGTFVVPDGFPRVGTVMRIHAGGTYGTTTGTQTLDLRLRFGTVAGTGPVMAQISLADTTDSMDGNTTWSCDFIVTFRAVTDGAGSVVSDGTCRFGTSNSNSDAATWTDIINGTVTVDTVGQATTMTLSADWGTSNAANKILLETWVVDVKR